MDDKYINILLNELNDVWSDKEKICFAGSSLSRLITEIEKQQNQIDRQQAKIDSLMLEYCPTEMTKEQLESWGEHQTKSSIQNIGENDG